MVGEDAGWQRALTIEELPHQVAPLFGGPHWTT